MEKKKNKFKKIILVIFLLLLIILIAFTVYKLNERHKYKLYDVLYSEIKYSAKQCYLKKECKSSTITLKDLYEKKYLDRLYDPISKEELNDNIKIIIKNDKIEIK